MLKNKIKINMVMSVVLLVSMTIIACNMDKVATVEMEKENKNVKTKNGKVVVIDPGDRKSTRLNSSHASKSRMPSSA